MKKHIILILLLSSVALAREASEYSDKELLAAGWTQEQINILKGRVSAPQETKNERMERLAKEFEHVNRNCVDESVQVLGADKTNEDTMSYWIACVESFGFSNAREVALESLMSEFVTANNVHQDSGKPFSMLVRERQNFEYEYCTSSMLKAGQFADYEISEAESCLRDFLWFEDQLSFFKSELSKLR